MVCTRVTLVRKISFLVTRIVSFGTAFGLHLLMFCILKPYPSKDTALDLVTLSHINDSNIVFSNQVLFESMLPSFPAAKI